MKKGYLYIIVTIVMFTSYEVVLRYIAGQIMILIHCRLTREQISVLLHRPQHCLRESVEQHLDLCFLSLQALSL